MPGAAAVGNVHSYTLSEVLIRFGPVANLKGIRMANVIRHPMAYIESHTALVRSAADYPPLRDHYRRMLAEALERRPELLDIPCQGGDDIEAFIVSCFSASLILDDLRCDHAPHVRMEDLTTDVDRSCMRACTERLPVVPILVEEDYRGFNVVSFRGRYLGLSQSLGQVNLFEVDDAWLTADGKARKIVFGETLIDAQKQFDQLDVDNTA